MAYPFPSSCSYHVRSWSHLGPSMELSVTYDLRPGNLEYPSQTFVMESIDSIPIPLAYFPALSSIHQHRQHIALKKPQLGRSAKLVRGPNLLHPNKTHHTFPTRQLMSAEELSSGSISAPKYVKVFTFSISSSLIMIPCWISAATLITFDFFDVHL